MTRLDIIWEINDWLNGLNLPDSFKKNIVNRYQEVRYACNISKENIDILLENLKKEKYIPSFIFIKLDNDTIHSSEMS